MPQPQESKTHQNGNARGVGRRGVEDDGQANKVKTRICDPVRACERGRRCRQSGEGVGVRRYGWKREMGKVGAEDEPRAKTR